MSRILSAFVALSLLVTLYYRTRAVAAERGGASQSTFIGQNVHSYWQQRLPAYWLSARFCLRGQKPTETELVHRAALWTVAWIGAAFALVIWRDRNLMLVLFVIHAGCMTAWLAHWPGTHIYPWDGPAIFFFTAAVYASIAGNSVALFLIIAAGFGFRESIALTALCFVLTETTWRRRLLWILAAGLVCYGEQQFIAHLTGSNFAPNSELINGHALPVGNLLTLFCLRGGQLYKSFYHPAFVGGGMLVVLLCLPNRKEILLWKLIAVLDVAGLMVYGIVTEYRIFLELIPVAAVWLSRHSLEADYPHQRI